MSPKATYATTYQLGTLLAALQLKQKGKSKKPRREKVSLTSVPANTKLITAATEGMRRTRVPNDLRLLIDFGELVAQHCVPDRALDPHLLAGAIEGYTRIRPFGAKELEYLPQAVIFSIYQCARSPGPRAKEFLAAAAKLEKSLKQSL